MEERLLELLRASIEKRMMADVPFGVFLSGGVDSSTNVALMSELMSDPVRTFSVAFRDQEQYNELEYAREIARRFGTDHHEVIIDSDDLESFLPELIFHQDEPIADWVCVPLHYVAKLARESGTIVVQVGEGSDELFHGYDGYISAARFRRRFWEPFQRVPAAAAARHRPRRHRARAARRAGRGRTRSQVAEAAAGPAAVLGRGDLLPGRDQGTRAGDERARPARLLRGRRSASGRRPSGSGRAPTCCRR